MELYANCKLQTFLTLLEPSLTLNPSNERGAANAVIAVLHLFSHHSRTTAYALY